MTKPQPIVRRTGAKPLPKVTLPMPRLTLTYNPTGYWQATATLILNASRAFDARVKCSFRSSERSVGEAAFKPTTIAPGDQVSMT